MASKESTLTTNERARTLVGVCVLNWNSGRTLATCLRNLESALASFRHQVVVVDNRSSDDSIALVRGQFANVNLIENEFNSGYARGNNVGANYLLDKKCDLLMFLNPDVTLKGDSIANLIQTLLARPDAGCVGGVPFAASGEELVAARTRPSFLEKLVMYGALHHIRPLEARCRKHFVNSRRVGEGELVYAACGACLLFRSTAFVQAGGFDEHTFLYEEEMIIAERLKACGWKVALCTTATYRHVGGHVTGRIPYRRRLYLISSENYLLRRYYNWNPTLCEALRLYRYAEWIGYAAVLGIAHLISHRSSRLRGGQLTD